MKPEDIRKLLGGYATGTLTEAERRALFEAALTDQDLFNELNRDQALQELLEDPAARRELLRALPEPARPRLSLGWRWAVAGGLAAAAMVAMVVVRTSAPQAKPEPVLMAKRQELSAPPPARPAATPAPKAEVKPDATTVPPAPMEPPAEKAVALPAPEAQQVEVTAAAAPVQVASSEKAERLDASQLNAISQKGRDALATMRFAAPSESSVVRSRILRRGAEGDYTEVDPRTEFQVADRVRVVFEPVESGRLRVTSGTAWAKILLDTSATRGGAYSVDLPPEEQKLVVTFSRDQGGAPVTVEIQILRQSSPR